MSNNHEETFYSTGMLAEACGVTVRTVQYYDEKGLLRPANRSEGGRRMYDEAGAGRLRSICLLKELGLSLRSIAGILEKPDDPAELLGVLKEQERRIQAETEKDRATLAAVRLAIEGVERDGTLPQDIDAIGIGRAMSTNDALSSTKKRMIIEGLVIDLFWIATIAYGIATGRWVPLLAGTPLVLLVAAELIRAYHRDACYVCPRCGKSFQPSMREFLFSSHNPKARKLSCPHCLEKSWCAERAVEEAAA